MGVSAFRMEIRRGILLGIAAIVTATTGLANAPAASLYPQMRPADLVRRAQPDAHDLIREARLDGAVGYVLRDGDTGAIIEEVNGDLPLPPASVAKALTAAYALSVLGVDHRFETQVIATGPVADGVVQGDIILAGGGDPTLDTDGLNDLALQLKAAGIRGVTGDLKIWGGACLLPV